MTWFEGVPELRPGQKIAHRLYGWPGRLSHREGHRWSVIWLPSEVSDGWKFSLQEEGDLKPEIEPGGQMKLLEEISRMK